MGSSFGLWRAHFVIGWVVGGGMELLSEASQGTQKPYLLVLAPSTVALVGNARQ